MLDESFAFRNVFGILSRSIFISRDRHICYEPGCISPICPLVMSVLRWCDDIYHENIMHVDRLREIAGKESTCLCDICR
jgi:hypothetical protein